MTVKDRIDIEREAFLTLAPFATEEEAHDNYLAEQEGPTCPICDGLGHGTICPLEEQGWEEARADEWREDHLLHVGGLL